LQRTLRARLSLDEQGDLNRSVALLRRLVRP
jgi:hypothetical protein